MNGLNSLPKGWARAEVRELVDLVNGYAFKPSQWSKTGLPIIRIQNLNNPDANFNHFEGGLPEKFLVQPGDLLFAWSGTPGTSFGAHVWRGHHAWLNQHIFKVQFDENHLDKRFLRLAINWNLEDYIAAAHGAAGLAHITKGVFEQSELLIPPLFEQRRMVAAIETQFTRLDASVAALERARANLKRYRAAVLKAACEGRLVPTEAEVARAEGRGYEPASVLLERIAAERDGVGAHGGAPLQVADDLPTVSDGWCWARFDGLLTYLRNGISIKPDAIAGTPILRISAVRPMHVDFEDVRFLSGPLSAYQEYVLETGDLLFTRYNGNPHLVGVCASVKSTSRQTVHPDKLIRAKVEREIVLPDFLQIVLNAGPSRDFIARRTRTTAGQSGISGGDIRSIPVPIPPIAEQHRIVAEVERRLSVVEEMEGAIGANLKRAERLRQAILRRAFAGKLVAQDPTDEPASVLVARIRAERAGKAPAMRRGRRVKNAAKVTLPLPMEG